jgi:hypothetical protein
MAKQRVRNGSAAGALALLAALALPATPVPLHASSAGHVVHREYEKAPDAPRAQSPEAAAAKSEGCMTCHESTDAASMHASSGVNLGCTDCHGGNATDPAARRPAGAERESEAYVAAMEAAHVLPMYPDDWKYPSSRNPEISYTLLNREAPEFVRFVNPSDYRVVEESCGACHMPIIQAAKRSIMATGAMLWGGASYNNGILPFKRYVLGEAYTRDGRPAAIVGPPLANADEALVARGVLPKLLPLPAWETLRPGDVFRIFERGGRNILNLFPETGIPNSAGLIQRLEEPGRPDFRQSNRGPGTGQRIAVPVINITKTRLNDPLMWFLGTNEQPGDFRTSGCGACHVVYGNDRDPRHSGMYGNADFHGGWPAGEQLMPAGQYHGGGHEGRTQTADPTIAKDESGHPLRHVFSRAIPTAQCMSCHMHQPNMFVNTYLGYTMWDYESDAPHMWPKEQRYPTAAEMRHINDRNPEGAAVRGLWSDPAFLRDVSGLNPQLSDTQFADYHGHGWNFRGIFKRDRKGNLLDADGNVVADDDPRKFDRSNPKSAVHMSSIHLDVGMHCVDCHFSQDAHGNGHIYGQVAEAVEIDCADCHGTADAYPTLKTTGPAAPPGGRDLSLIRNPDGKRRFEWRGSTLIQRSLLNPGLEWEVSLVKDSVTPGSAHYNEKAARAKLMSNDTARQDFGVDVPPDQRAHRYSLDPNVDHSGELECYACHISWTTSCGGCHLPIEANWLTERHHYEGGISRNYATYNPQVARDEVFMLGRREPSSGGRIAPLRSTSALVLSSTNAARERIYVQQPPVASSGYSSQAINPHIPHTERKTETKTCSDCHLSRDNDNNAIMAQTLGFGTDYIDLLGFSAYVGTEGSVDGIQVTEWDEPQAVIGSYLHEYAYPDFFRQHVDRGRELQVGHTHAADRIGCLQLRGEYLYAAVGSEGMRAYDVAGIANKGISQRILTSPVGPWGQDTQVESRNATCVALATTQPVHPDRNVGHLMRVVNQEKPFHPIYKYALVTDAEEGLILVDYQTLADGEPRNNFLERALTWNPGGLLAGARHITVGGRYVYIVATAGLVVLDLDDPLAPRHLATVPLNGGRASHLQFRYLFVTDADGLKAIDVTDPAQPRLVPGNTVPFADARGVFVARTYAYVAAGGDGLAIVDVTNPERMSLYQKFDGNGTIVDATDVVVAHTNASPFAYVADGIGGLKVVQLTSPRSQPKFYGFAPEPKPELVAWYPTQHRALSLSRALERDRAVDETGGQVAVFGRVGSGPLTHEDMRRMYLDADGKPWFVSDQATAPPAAAARPVDRARPAASTGQQAATGGAAGTGQAATQRSVEGTSDGE